MKLKEIPIWIFLIVTFPLWYPALMYIMYVLLKDYPQSEYD